MKRVPWFFLTAGAFLLLSACSGLIGGDTVVRMSIGAVSGGRYIDQRADTGYVAVLKEGQIYSAVEVGPLAYEEFENGYLYLNSIPPGEYIFVVSLIGPVTPPVGGPAEDMNVGLAIKKISITKGFNDVVIDVGPGIHTFTVTGASNVPVTIDNFVNPTEYSISYAEDTFIIGGIAPKFSMTGGPYFYYTVDLQYQGTTPPAYPLPLSNMQTPAPGIAADFLGSADGKNYHLYVICHL